MTDNVTRQQQLLEGTMAQQELPYPFGDEEKSTEVWDTFITVWEFLADNVHQQAKKSGWWDGGPEHRNKGEMLALIHSELSEVLEGLRHGNPQSEKIPSFSVEEEELADTVIRVLDYAAGFSLQVGAAIIAKLDYNRSRSYRHGGKKF